MELTLPSLSVFYTVLRRYTGGAEAAPRKKKHLREQGERASGAGLAAASVTAGPDISYSTDIVQNSTCADGTGGGAGDGLANDVHGGDAWCFRSDNHRGGA